MKKCKNGKVKFRTEKEANRARMYILSHDPSAGMFDLMPYVCPLCGFFHVGHRSKYTSKASPGVLPAQTAQRETRPSSGASRTASMKPPGRQ